MITTLLSIAKIGGLRLWSGVWALLLSPGGRTLVQMGLIAALAAAGLWWVSSVRSDLVEQGRREARTQIEREARKNVEKAQDVRRAGRGAGARGVQLDPYAGD